jgi:hypothetical protein
MVDPDYYNHTLRSSYATSVREMQPAFEKYRM